MTDSPPTRREMNLRVFRRQPLPHVFFQPRFEPWVAWHKQFDSLPASCAGRDLRELFDDLGASIRYVDYYTGQPSPIRRRWSPEVKLVEKRDPEWIHRTYQTPHGDLTEDLEFTVDRTWRVVGFLGRKTEDLPALRWLLERQTYEFDPEAYRKGDAWIGERGIGQFYLPKSPYLAMAQQWMRFEAFIYALSDAPDQVEDIFRVIDERYDDLYRRLCELRITPIINFGENVAEAHMGPRWFEEYLLPWYQKRCGQLRDAGIFSHIHIDGYFRTLLPLLGRLPHDGLEALTPLPQGDVTLEEIAEHIGDKVLLDGVPAVLFLDHHPREQLQECVQRVVELFHPRLVLGVSDELPQAATEEGYQRMRWVAEYCRRAGAGSAESSLASRA